MQFCNATRLHGKINFLEFFSQNFMRWNMLESLIRKNKIKMIVRTRHSFTVRNFEVYIFCFRKPFSATLHHNMGDIYSSDFCKMPREKLCHSPKPAANLQNARASAFRQNRGQQKIFGYVFLVIGKSGFFKLKLIYIPPA